MCGPGRAQEERAFLPLQAVVGEVPVDEAASVRQPVGDGVVRGEAGATPGTPGDRGGREPGRAPLFGERVQVGGRCRRQREVPSPGGADEGALAARERARDEESRCAEGAAVRPS